MNQQKQIKKPPASVVPFAEQENLQGVIDATLRVAEARVQKLRRMRQAIIADDVETTLAMACELAGFSQQDAVKQVERLLSLAAKISA